MTIEVERHWSTTKIVVEVPNLAASPAQKYSPTKNTLHYVQGINGYKICPLSKALTDEIALSESKLPPLLSFNEKSKRFMWLASVFYAQYSTLAIR